MSFDDFISIYGSLRFPSCAKASRYIHSLYSPSSWLIVHYGSYFYVVHVSDYFSEEVYF